MPVLEMIDDRTFQRFLITQGLYHGKPDGLIGDGSWKGIKYLLGRSMVPYQSWPQSRMRLAAEQLMLKTMGFNPGAIDGKPGPQTFDALERYQNKIRDVEPPADAVAHQSDRWPRERNVMEFFGRVGTDQVTLELPYEMRLAWDVGTVVRKIQCHRLVHDAFGAILTEVYEVYAPNEIHDLGLDLFGGCLNVRAKKGAKSYSMHSWGIAMDIDPDHNQLRWRRDKARLARSEYLPFWKAVERQGMISLGREKNYDWMHFQAARF